MSIDYSLFDVNVISVLATLIGIILVSVFELFRLAGVTMAMMLLLASGRMSVVRHRQLGSRAVI